MSEQLSVPADCRPTPEDFVKFLPYACTQMLAPFYVQIQQVTIGEYMNKDAKGKSKSKRVSDTISTAASTIESHLKSSLSPLASVAAGPVVALTAMRDPAGRLVELQFRRCAQIPTLLLRLIALCLPYHPALTRVTVRWGPPQSRLLRELAALLPHSNITDLCLDDTPALQHDCHALLAPHMKLLSLSLARCDLDDEDCAMLAARLRHPEPAAYTLAALSLASNAIADTGATALGETLRTNRTLRHLNLAGNRITDDGAGALLRSLARFRLTADEVADKRQRLLDYLRRKEVIYAQCLNELLVASGEKAPPEKSTASARKKPLKTRERLPSAAVTMDAIALRAEAMTAELLGAPLEPFGVEHTLRRADGLHCVGNLVLSHLNLAYNNLQFASLTLLLRVLQAQTAGTAGLLRVQLDGNLLPVACDELQMVGELLARALGAEQPKQTDKRSDRVKKKSYFQ